MTGTGLEPVFARSAIASIAKPMTAAAIMQLVETNAVDLDAPIARYVPEFAPSPPPGDHEVIEAVYAAIGELAALPRKDPTQRGAP